MLFVGYIIILSQIVQKIVKIIKNIIFSDPWPGVAMTKFKGDVWVSIVPAGTTGCLFNAGDGDATKTTDFVVENNHKYNKKR